MKSLATLLVLCAMVPTRMQGQETSVSAPSDALSPKAAYVEAMHPLEVTRHSIANWSDSEVAALGVAIKQANVACGLREAKDFRGEPLLDLARLCALGQNFGRVAGAASQYLAQDSDKAQLTDAYALLIDADLHLKDEPAALATGLAMLKAAPYGVAAADSTNEALEYMQFVHGKDALRLAQARQPLLLAQLSSMSQPVPAVATPGEVQSLHRLYIDGLWLASQQQLLRSGGAEATLRELDAALPTKLLADDSIPIAAARRRYALLGRPLPTIPGKAYLSMPNQIPALPASHAMTALLIFPDWCAQCLRMTQQMPQTVFKVSGHETYMYALLAETVPPRKPSADEQAANPAFAEARLRETATITVPPALLDTFGVDDVPFLLITDAQGIVRVAQVAGEGATSSGGAVDSAVALVGETWPLLAMIPTGNTASVPGKTPSQH